MKPWWDPQQTADFTRPPRTNQCWRRLARKSFPVFAPPPLTFSPAQVLSGMFNLPLSAGISGQMRRIPNLHYSISMLQVSAGSAGVWTFMLPGILLCVSNYDLDRPIVITQVILIGFVSLQPVLMSFLVLPGTCATLLARRIHAVAYLPHPGQSHSIFFLAH